MMIDLFTLTLLMVDAALFYTLGRLTAHDDGYLEGYNVLAREWSLYETKRKARLEDEYRRLYRKDWKP